MANVLINENTMSAIGDAIREKTGKTDKILPANMASEIKGIEAGGANEPYIEETYDANDNLIGVKLFGYTKIRDYTFYGCTNLALTSLSEGLTSIGSNAFASCTNLALTSLPEGLTSIGNSAFQYCTNLALTSLPEGLTTIGNYAFNSCTNLTNITFKGTPNSIGRAFNVCSNLTTINVPWSEGAVSGAPWGATNATINYDYSGEEV